MARLSDWNKIQQSREYWDYSPEYRAIIKAMWFKKNIAPTQEFQSYPDEDKLNIAKAFSTYAEDEAPPRTFWDVLGDVGISAFKGVVGAGEAVVGLADIPTLGLVGEALEKVGYDPQKTREIVEQGYSPAQKSAFEQVEKAKGFVGTAKEMITHPSTIAHGAIESSPSMIGAGAGARALAAHVPKLATAGGRLVGSAIGEGAFSAGQSAEQIRQERGLLTPGQAGATVASGIGTGAFALVGSRLAKKLGFADVDAMLAGAGTNVNKGGVARRIVEGGISEGAFEELPQSLQEQIWQNAALNKPIMEGVPEAGAQGGLVGAFMGAGANVVARRQRAQENISTATNVDEAVKAFEEATQPSEPFISRSGGLLVDEFITPRQEAGFRPSVEVEGTPTPDMGPTAMQRLRGEMAGKPWRYVDDRGGLIEDIPAPRREADAEARRGQAEEAGREEGVQGRPGEEVRLRDDEQAGAPGVRDEAKAEEVRGLINDAATEAATSPENDLPEPTEAQKEAGNYRKGHISLHGMDISIENPVGSTREGVSKEGKPWKTEMKSHYGYIRRTENEDGEQIDVFIGPQPTNETVFVVDQVDPETGKFDEFKVMMGFPTEEEARAGYLENYEKGWKGLGALRPMQMDQFKEWLKDPKKAEIPTAEEQAPIATTGKIDADATQVQIGTILRDLKAGLKRDQQGKYQAKQGTLDALYERLQYRIEELRKQGDLDEQTVQRIGKSGAYDQGHLSAILPEFQAATATKGPTVAKPTGEGEKVAPRGDLGVEAPAKAKEPWEMTANEAVKITGLTWDKWQDQVDAALKDGRLTEDSPSNNSAKKTGYQDWKQLAAKAIAQPETRKEAPDVEKEEGVRKEEKAQRAEEGEEVKEPKLTQEQLRNLRSRINRAHEVGAGVAGIEAAMAEYEADPANWPYGYKSTLDALNIAIAEKEKADKQTPEGREAQLEKLQKDLERKGAGTIGAVHYQIREREDLPPGKGYYFRRTEGGNRQDVGTTNYDMWDMNQAVYNAMENAKDVKIEPGPAPMRDWEKVSGSNALRSKYGNYLISGEPGQYRLSDESTGRVIGGTYTDQETASRRANEDWLKQKREEPKPELKASEATAEDLLAMWDEEAAKVEGEKESEEKLPSWAAKKVGINTGGETLYEDKDGNRIYSARGFVRSAPRLLMSSRGEVMKPYDLDDLYKSGRYEWLTKEEVEQFKAKEKPKEEPKEEPEAKFKEGDRVILKDVYNQDMDGRHGTVSKVDVSTFYMTPVLAGQTTKQVDIRYDVKTDAGAVARMVSPDNISAETGQAPAFTQDVEINPGEFMSPIRVLSDIRQKREYARGQKAKAQRAKKSTQINKYKQTASDYERAADELQAKYDDWAAKNKPGEQKPEAKASVTGTLDDYGLKVTKTTTKNGTPVWQVSGNTKEHSEHIKAAGGRWYGPKKVWSFYNSDPTQDILDRLPKKETVKLTETIFNLREGTIKQGPTTEVPKVPEDIARGKPVSEGEPLFKKGERVEFIGYRSREKGTGTIAEDYRPTSPPTNVGISGDDGMHHYAGTDEITRLEEKPTKLEEKRKETVDESLIVLGPATEEEVKTGASDKLASWVQAKINRGESFTSSELFAQAASDFGGTQAEGKFTPKDAYDAVELGVNRWITEHPAWFDLKASAEKAKTIIGELKTIISRLPTQTKRTEEFDEFQQFSTPPSLGYAANWVASVRPSDVYMEPSVGVGGLAAFAKSSGPQIVVNELSPRRLGLVKLLEFDRYFSEDAAQLNNILPKDIKPTVVVMNPPFSATAGRMGKGYRKTQEGAKHIEQALKRLEPGGRLVAITGEGMAADRPAFREWWKKISQEYNVRANIGVSGQEYKKYGTTFDNQLLVIDKTPPKDYNPIIGKVDSVEELIPLLEGVRNDRTSPIQSKEPQPTVEKAPEIRESEPGARPAILSPTGEVGVGEREGGPATTGTAREPRKSPVRVEPEERDEVPGRGAQLTERPVGEGTEVAPESGRGRVEPTGQPVEREPGGIPEAEGLTSELQVIAKQKEARGEITEDLYEGYTPERLTIKDAQRHPTPLVQSAAMAAVLPPEPTYKPNIPTAPIKQGKISDIQMESVVYAGQAHEQFLPDGTTRRGYFIGDGTGVGKGREIAAILWDNWNKGRKKAVWLSEKKSLFEDAKRDTAGVGWNPKLIFDHGKIKADADIVTKQGILFTTYDTLKSKPKDERAKSRLEQIVSWLGEDFDGVIAFDESHNMGNAVAVRGERGTKQPSQKALTGVALQKRLPKARIVYVSATGATEVINLAYAERLGVWGEGTPFATKEAFVTQISAGGMAAMEMVARDLKSFGVYTARSLSYDGVAYDRLEHVLSPDQRETYNKLAEGWQLVLREINKALEAIGVTGTKKDGGEKTLNAQAKARALSIFWGAHQRFFNQVITAMQTPSVIKAVHNDLKAGDAVVIQLVNTMEAAQERAIGKLTEEDSLADIDLTPRDILMQMVQNSFPTTQFEEYVDEDGNVRSRPVVDSKGNPVENSEAVAMREALLDQLGSIKVPDSPLDMIIEEFGPKNVAEITGRRRRVVTKTTERGQERVIEKRSRSKAMAEADEFQHDKRKILIFSEAGGTGRSYHADLDVKNQRKRVHYLLQAGWRADKAVQGLGRTHRSNQKQPPKYFLVTTDLKGQKRFLSSIARRLDQLGALTKGQRQTGSQGIFQARDNLESEYATDALKQFFDDLARNQVESITQAEFAEQTGLRLVDDYGNLLQQTPQIRQFLNRLLSLNIDTMNNVFDEFSQRMDRVVEGHVRAGTLDQGLETLKAQKIEKIDEETVYTDAKSGSETKYVQLDVTNPTEIFDWDAARYHASDGFWINKKSGKIWAAKKHTITKRYSGALVDEYVLRSVTYSENRVEEEDFTEEKWEKVSGQKAKKEWDKAIAEAPKTRTRKEHLLTGALLPIWDRIHGHPKIMRLQTAAGERMIGRLLREGPELTTTLRNLGARGAQVTITAEEMFERLLEQNYSMELANGWDLYRRRVSGDERIEIKGPDYRDFEILEKYGVFSERINWETRYFVPTEKEQGVSALKSITKNSPVVAATPPYGIQAELATRSTKGTPVKILEGHVRRLQRNAKGAAPTTVLRNLKDLPKNILGKIPPSYFAENQVIRALHVRIRETGKAEVFLFSDNIPNLAEATKSWVHEQFGHNGIRLVLTEEQHRQFMRNVYFAKQKQIDPLAKQYKYDVATAEGRVKAADEWFARQVAEKGFEKDPWLKRQFDRLVRMINNGLRKMGLDIQLSGAEIREMMRAAQKRGLQGPPGDVQVSSVSAEIGAWHGSPHKFDKFKAEKIGTGEGAQSFGWGLYFTSEKEIADHYAQLGAGYKEILFEGKPSKSIYDALSGWGKDVLLTLVIEGKNAAIEKAKGYRGMLVNTDFEQAKAMEHLKSDIEANKIQANPQRQTYRVTLHKGKKPGEYDYLKWDEKVINEKQKEAIKDVYDDLTNRETDYHKASRLSRYTEYEFEGKTGEDVYRELSNELGSDKEASIALLRAGIDGIEYPAGTLSGVKSDAKNYVVFDENAITIEEPQADLGRTEKDTVTLEQPDGTTLELPTLVNASESRLRGLLNRSKEKEIRAMIGPDGNVYAWDATLATHADVADFYGFKYRDARMYQVPEWDFDTKVAEIRGLTEADISAELAAVAPIIQETFDVPEAHPTLSAIKGAFKREAVTREAVTRYSNTIRTEVIDKYHPIKALGEVPYQLHRMLGNAHAVIATFLDHGKLAWKDQALMVTEKGQGFLPWLRNLGEDGRNLFYWMAAKRAEKLEAEDRENWLTPDKRQQIYDAVFAGLSPAERAAKERRFEQLNQEFQKWNKNVIAIARQAGLLNHEQINAWMKHYYLPFYRLLEDEVTREEFLKAPHKSKKHIDAQIRRLKGGEEKIGDPIENILRNWAHLIQESQRNIARSAAADVAIPMGLAEEVPAKELSKVLGSRTVKIWAVKRMGAKRAGKLFDDPDDAQAYADQQTEETGKQYNVVEQKTTSVMFGRKEDFRIVSYQRDGETVYLRVQDPHLFNALSEMNAKAFDSSLLKIFTGAKRLLTAGATFSPAFRIANLLRDTLHTAVVSKSFAPFIDSFRGAVKVWKESPEYVQLMGSGGGFGMGWVESGDPKAMARAIEKIIKREGKDASWRILSTPRKMLSFWEKVGRASEMAARVQLYSNLRLKGETHLKAAFEARDLLDFYLSGSSNAVRVMTAVTPFLNARMQGLDRMYRGAKANPAGFMVKGAAVAGASLMLWALFKDDDRYKELEDWEKWQYHHFWIGPHHFRIPKAFEVGAVFSSLFETAANVMTGQEEFKFFGRFLAHSLTETFAVNMPAAFGPTIEVFANRSLFTGRPIESMGLQRLPEGKRAKPWTPEILKGLGEGLNISPLKMQHILLGHTATFGSMFLTAADSMYRLASDAPAKPSMRVEQTPALGRFVRGDARATKYATRYYEISREIDELVGTINYYRRLGDFEAARDLVTEKRALYTQRRIASNVDSQLRRLRRKEEMVWASRALSPKDKRLQLDAIVAQENTIYKTAYERLSP